MPRASTPFAAARPTDGTHADMTETKPTQPTIPARPNTVTRDTSLPQRLEAVTEPRGETQQFSKFRPSYTLLSKWLHVIVVLVIPRDGSGWRQQQQLVRKVLSAWRPSASTDHAVSSCCPAVHANANDYSAAQCAQRPVRGRNYSRVFPVSKHPPSK